MVGGPISIQALTWNMGNKNATKDAVNDIFGQLVKPAPTVLSISTQEELAPNGERLVDLLKKKLEADGSQYELVETYHTTMAGANNSKKTLAKALFTDQNRVSTAVLVKKPFVLQNAQTRIDYQSNAINDENKKVNKSIITVEGKLTDGKGNPIMDISVSGGHFDANQDQKRRAHANKYLKNSGLKTTGAKSFDEIYDEASAFKIITGDFNERNQLFGLDKKIKAVDMMKQTNFKSYGFDVDKQPQMNKGGQPLKGTYGLNGINDPDPKTQRKHVTKGGFLDRVAYNCGLIVKEGNHGFDVDANHMVSNKKGKIFYHGSDHLPVLRSFQVIPPDPDAKAIIVAKHIQRRIPDFNEEIDQIKFLIQNKDRLMQALDVVPLQHHDSEYTKQQFIRIYAGVGPNVSLNEVITGLENKLATLKGAHTVFDQVNGKVSTAALSKPPDNQFLESVFNQINKCHDLKNALQEINDLPEKKMSKEDKALFKQLAGKLVDDMYQCAGKRLNGEKANIPVNLQLSILLDKYSNLPVVQRLSEAKNQVTTSLQVMDFSINTPQLPAQKAPSPPLRKQSAEKLPSQSFEPERVKKSNHFDVDFVKTLTKLYSSGTNKRADANKRKPSDVEPAASQSKKPKNF